MFVINDRHGLWSLQIFHGFNADGGTIRRGWYVKQINEADAPTTVHVSSLMRLEDVEALNRSTPRRQAEMLHDTKYRGAMCYAAVSGYPDFGVLYDRMELAMNEYNAAYAAAIGGIHGEPGPVEPAPVDTRPTWQLKGFASKQEWRNAGSPK